MQWEKSKLLLFPGSNDLHKPYPAKLDDAKILSGNGIRTVTRKNYQNSSRGIVAFESRAKEPPNLNATIE